MQNIQTQKPLKFSHFVSLNHFHLQNEHKTWRTLLHIGKGFKWGSCFNQILCSVKASSDALIPLKHWETEQSGAKSSNAWKCKKFEDYKVIHKKAENFLLMPDQVTGVETSLSSLYSNKSMFCVRGYCVIFWSFWEQHIRLGSVGILCTGCSWVNNHCIRTTGIWSHLDLCTTLQVT